MQILIDLINNYLTVFGVPGTTVVAAAAILALSVILNRVFSLIVLKSVQRLTRKTKTTLDDTIVAVLKGPLGWLIVLGGLWMAHTILAGYLSAQLNETIQKGVSLGLVVVSALIVYRSAGVLAQLLQTLTKRTRTEIDDLILPYLPAFIQAVAVLLVVIKASEILLGVSAAALVGLLGGAGITLGLVFKDVLADWFATVIIYADDLYREGDMIATQDGSFAIVEKIGLRSTAIRTYAGPVIRIPNSQMVAAGTANWSQAKKWKADYKLSLDGVPSGQVKRITEGLREILKSEKDVDQSWHMVYLSKIEGNSRVINIEYCPDPAELYTSTGLDADPYYDRFALTIEKVNLAILALLEREQIDPLAYTLFGSIGDYRRRTATERTEDQDKTVESLLMAEQRE
jgi:MscS family membrane protein